MEFIYALLLFLIILFSYISIVLVLNKKGILKKIGIKLYGPALLLRTKKGLKFLKNVSKKDRFWLSFGNFAIFFCFIMMILMTFLLVWQAWTIIGFTPEQKEALPGPEVALVLPGINPILPLEYLGYIIIALVIAIVTHEFSHGIVTFAEKLKIKSMGLVYLIVPIGAFVEPDEEQLKKAEKIKRMRIYSSGPLANFLVVLIVILLFSFVFMSAVEPIEPVKEGLYVFDVIKDSAADKIDIKRGAIILSINKTNLSNFKDFNDRFEAYSKAVSQIRAGDTVEINYYLDGRYYNKEITFDDKYNYTKNITDIGKGYSGIYSFINVEKYLEILKNPISTDFPKGFIFFYVIPLTSYFEGYNPILSPFTDSYLITGPLSVLHKDVFWTIINALYWIFWLNLAVGLFNVLPMLPLDGGFLFNDVVDATVRKIKKDISEEKRERIVKSAVLTVSLVILVAILLPYFIKYI